MVPIRVRPYQGSAKIVRSSPAGTMQAAVPISSFSWETVTWVPRLGAILGTSASSWISSGRMRSAQTPVALITFGARHVEGLPCLGLAARDACRQAVLLNQLRHLDAVQRHHPEAVSLAEDRKHEANVVRLAVVEEIGLTRVPRGESWDQLGGLLAWNRAVPVGRPAPGIRGLLRALPAKRCLPATVAARPDPSRRHHVVGVETDPDQAVLLEVAQRRDQERSRVDEMWRQFNHELALDQGLTHQP